MNRNSLILALLLSLQAEAVTLNTPAPLFSLPTESGEVALSDHKGKVVYLDFWASWCGPCRSSFPWMNEMQNRYGDNNFVVIAVNLDSNSTDAQTFLSQYSAQFTVVFDPKGNTPASYELLGMPSAYLIDKEGNVRFEHIGFDESQKSEYEAHIRQMLNLN